MVWESCSDRADVSRPEFDRYFHGAPEAIGISLSAIHKINAIDIERLKTWKAGFHPPQVMLKISANDARNLRKLVSEGDQIASRGIALSSTRRSELG
jgi:hypothetical protein